MSQEQTPFTLGPVGAGGRGGVMAGGAGGQSGMPGGAGGAGAPGGAGEAGGQGGMAAGGGNVFRAHRYGPDYPGLAGKDLTPQGQIVEDVKGGWEPRVDLAGATQAGAKLWKKLWKKD